MGLTTTFVYFIWKSLSKSSYLEQATSNGEVHAESKQPRDLPKKKAPKIKVCSSKSAYSHPWLLTSLKGHTSDVIAMDINASGKHLALTAEDRSIIIWNTKDFDQKEHKHVRGKVEYDFIKISYSICSIKFLENVVPWEWTALNRENRF